LANFVKDLTQDLTHLPTPTAGEDFSLGLSKDHEVVEVGEGVEVVGRLKRIAG